MSKIQILSKLSKITNFLNICLQNWKMGKLQKWNMRHYSVNIPVNNMLEKSPFWGNIKLVLKKSFLSMLSYFRFHLITLYAYSYGGFNRQGGASSKLAPSMVKCFQTRWNLKGRISGEAFWSSPWLPNTKNWFRPTGGSFPCKAASAQQEKLWMFVSFILFLA